MWVVDSVFRSCAIVIMLTVTRVEVLQGVLGVESSSSSKRAATARSQYDRDPVRDGVRVDGQREHQSTSSGTPRCKQV